MKSADTPEGRSLAGSFLDEVKPDSFRNDATRAHLEMTLTGILARARQRWPGIEVDPETFVRNLARRVDAVTTPQGLRDNVHFEDLLLVLGCLRHDSHAMRHFELEIMPEIRRAAALVWREPAFVEDVSQDIAERLLVGKEGPPRFGDFSARGRLSHWIVAMTVREAQKRRQRNQRFDAELDSNEAAASKVAGANPELSFLHSHYRADFVAAVTSAFESLSSRERTLLRLHVFDQLSIDELGRLYQAHRATAARWLGRARERLFSETRRLLADRFSTSGEELNSLIALMASKVEVSLRNLLKTPVA